MSTRDLETNSISSPVLSRRSLIAKGAAVTIVAAVVPMKFANAALCQDPEELSSTDYSFRKYVQFTEAWPNKDETCRRCAAFMPGPDENACGRCRAVAGGINPNGHCTGWERKRE